MVAYGRDANAWSSLQSALDRAHSSPDMTCVPIPSVPVPTNTAYQHTEHELKMTSSNHIP